MRKQSPTKAVGYLGPLSRLVRHQSNSYQNQHQHQHPAPAPAPSAMTVDEITTSPPQGGKTNNAQIEIDDIELQAQGYQRAMPRRFSLLSLMSMSYALLATWNGFGSAFGTGFIEASSAGSIWTLTIAAAMTAVTGIGMAELSSVSCASLLASVAQILTHVAGLSCRRSTVLLVLCRLKSRMGSFRFLHV